MELWRYRAGRTPLLVSMPHTGTYVPEPLLARLTPAARALPDTDWHLERLYDFLDDLGASVLVATHSRYVVDLNRPPDNASLYPGQDTTGIVPLDTFHKQPVYLASAPAEDEVRARIEAYWRPYHAKLAAELARLKDAHGHALLWDAHSIFSELPRFFSGRLPELNLGTADGRACGPGIGEALLAEVRGYRAVLNGRFKGGYITRSYGHPEDGIHAVQLELAESAYMDETPPYRFRDELAARLRPQLRRLLETFVRLARAPRKD
ncbi:MAG TPA: N-formylglutamate deformylase [Burkholderiales bacterium]|nr:N-formylglutamate deformylase [Burkholderiales bacterium]